MKLKKYPILIKPRISMGTEHLDAAERVYYGNQLVEIEKELLRNPQPPLNSETMFPYRTSTDELAKKVEWYIISDVGVAALITDYSTGLKLVKTFRKKQESEIYTIGDGIQFAWDDIQRAARDGADLPTEDAEAAMRAINAGINEVAFIGNQKANLKGVLTHPNIIIMTAADIGGGVTAWSLKSDAQIRADISSALTLQGTATKNMEFPTDFAGPPNQMRLLNETFVGTNNDTTLMQRIKIAYPNFKKFHSAHELQNVPLPSGDGTGDVIILYEYNIKKSYVEVPMPPKRGRTVDQLLTSDTAFLARTGAFVSKFPASIVIIEKV